MRLQLKKVVLIVCFFISMSEAMAQVSTNGSTVITTAASFLTISPESRAGAMGDVGVATAPDINSQNWNAAKYAFIESQTGFSLSYTPWMRKIVSDMNLAYLSGYTKLDKQQVLSGSLRYFSLGQVTFRNENGESQGIQNPNEFAIDFGYTRLLSDNFSGSVVFRYIRSDLGTVSWGTESLRPGNAFAADVSFYYQKKLNPVEGMKVISAGINVSNLGSKISYEPGVNYFLPANLRLGVAYSTELDPANKLIFAFDANKLLVPSQKNDTIQGAGVVVGGSSSDKSVLGGAFSSFTDVGLKEELQEITLGVGCEYLYNKQFALRTGYFYESQNNGNRKYFTMGTGLKLNAFSLDFAYLIPTQQNHPLENTLRFTLSFDLGPFSKAIKN